jgi:hypothetical protein
MCFRVKSWKFIPTNHGRLRFIERVLPIIGEWRGCGDTGKATELFCSTTMVAPPHIATRCRRIRANKGDKPWFYLWSEQHGIAVVGRAFLFQDRIDYSVKTFLVFD